MIKKINFPKFTFVLLLVILIYLGISIPVLISPMRAEDDAFARIRDATSDYQQQIILSNNRAIWLPLHFTFLVITLLVNNSPNVTPRFGTFFLSLISVFFFYRYYKACFQDEKKAFLSAIIYLFLPLRIFLSTATYSESVFLTFFILSLFYLMKEKPNYLVSLLALNIAHGMRYESWFFLPIYWWIIIDNKKLTLSNAKKGFIIILSLLFPCYWLINNYLTKGSGFYFIFEKFHIAQNTYSSAYWDFDQSFLSWKEKLVESIGLLPFIITLVGFYLKISKLFNNNRPNKNQIIGILLPFFFFFSLVFQVFVGSMEWFPHRYLLFSISFAIPFFTEGLLFLLKKEIIFLPLSLTIVTILFFQYVSVFIKTQAFIIEGNSIIVKNMKQVISFINLNSIERVQYVYRSDNRFWLDNQFYFGLQDFSSGGQSVEEYTQSSCDKEIVIVAEKSDENLLSRPYHLLFENYHFIVFKPLFCEKEE